MAENKPLRLGDALLEADLISHELMEMAIQKQKVTKERLGELMLRLGIVSEFDLANLLANQKGVEFAKIDTLGEPDRDILALFNQELCLNRGFLPLKKEDSDLVIILGNATLEDVEHEVRLRTGLTCKALQGEFSKVVQAIRYNFHFIDHPIEELFQREMNQLENDIEQVVSPDPFIDYLMHLAIKERASDVHLQPEQNSIHISFRIDGVLIPMFAMSRRLGRVIANIKLRASMDISDTLRPQDGSFSVKIVDMTYDVRVSSLVTEHGEHIVMRLLSGDVHVLGLNELGLYDEDAEQLTRLFSNPHGIVLMTGPTGSGKSTTLHAGLHSKGMIGKNILTVEDPIEYKFPIICQTEVNRRSGYEFAEAIRHFLRHDPDVMLIGEIRDPETAEAAITAAETGHLVLSTLHVNTVLGVISRLLSLKIHSQTLGNSLLGVINQRLSRTICTHCREEYTPSEEEAKYFIKEPVDKLYRGAGCSFCRGSGNFGRIPIYETMLINRELEELISTGATKGQLMEEMVKHGFKPIEENALRRVREGIITLDEAVRLLGSSLEEYAQ